MMLIFFLATILLLSAVLICIFIEEKRWRRLSSPRGRIGDFWTGKERRQFVRFGFSTQARYYREEHSPFRKYGVRSRDLSIGGIRMTVEEILTVATPLTIEIDLPDGSKPVTVAGKVAWSREVGNGMAANNGKRIFEAGVKFISLSPADEKRIEKFFDQQALKNEIPSPSPDSRLKRRTGPAPSGISPAA